MQPQPVQLGLAEAVVEHQPGARHGGARAVAARRRDGAAPPVAVHGRDVRRRRRGGQPRESVPLHLLEQRVAVLLQVL